MTKRRLLEEEDDALWLRPGNNWMDTFIYYRKELDPILQNATWKLKHTKIRLLFLKDLCEITQILLPTDDRRRTLLLFAALQILDRFLQIQPSGPMIKSVFEVALSSVWVASKLENTVKPEDIRALYATKQPYSSFQEILQTEMDICMELMKPIAQPDGTMQLPPLLFPTPIHYLWFYFQLLTESKEVDISHEKWQLIQARAIQLITITSAQADYVRYSAASVAMAACEVAMKETIQYSIWTNGQLVAFCCKVN